MPLKMPGKKQPAAKRSSPVAAGEAPLPVRRKPGRPARISRELIIQASMEILASGRVEDFMIKTVAHKLGTASMAIYNYFDSRDELLVAVADEVCLLFKPPKPRATWQATLMAWLWALKKHADQYPVMPSIIGINGHTSVGWMKITAPITVLMHEQLGLRNKALAIASSLFVTNAAAMIHVLALSAEYRKPGGLPRIEELGLDERQTNIYRKMPFTSLRDKELFDGLFAQMIKGLEIFLPDQR